MQRGWSKRFFKAFLDAERWQGSIQELVQQIRQLKQFGVTESELERAKERQITSAHVVNENIPTFRSTTHMQNIMGHVVEGDPLWPEDCMKEITERWTPLITIDDINNELSALFDGDGVVVYLLTPDTEHTSEGLKRWIEAAEAIEVEPYEEISTEGGLMEEQLVPGSIIQALQCKTRCA